MKSIFTDRALSSHTGGPRLHWLCANYLAPAQLRICPITHTHTHEAHEAHKAYKARLWQLRVRHAPETTTQTHISISLVIIRSGQTSVSPAFA